jgi:hypothetical protein
VSEKQRNLEPPGQQLAHTAYTHLAVCEYYRADQGGVAWPLYANKMALIT